MRPFVRTSVRTCTCLKSSKPPMPATLCSWRVVATTWLVRTLHRPLTPQRQLLMPESSCSQLFSRGPRFEPPVNHFSQEELTRTSFLSSLTTSFMCKSCVVSCRSVSAVKLTRLALSRIDVSGGDKIPRKGGPGISQVRRPLHSLLFSRALSVFAA